MTTMTTQSQYHSIGSQILRRALVGAIAFGFLLAAGVQVAQSAELVPAYGWSKPTDSDATSKGFGSIALRANMLPALQTEIQVGYRQEDRFNDQLHVKMIPVTASLYLKPVPVIYAGGGVGWYHTTLDYESSLGFADETNEEFGVHLGGGLQVPLAPMAAVDLGGRYVMMRDQSDRLIPERFNPDFWTMTLGLAIKF
jgi:hypothetical protein